MGEGEGEMFFVGIGFYSCDNFLKTKFQDPICVHITHTQVQSTIYMYCTYTETPP